MATLVHHKRGEAGGIVDGSGVLPEESCFHSVVKPESHQLRRGWRVGRHHHLATLATHGGAGLVIPPLRNQFGKMETNLVFDLLTNLAKPEGTAVIATEIAQSS